MQTYELDEIANAALEIYSRLSFEPPNGKFTILAAFVLRNSLSGEPKVISLGTGSKCLPEIRLCKEGDTVHDSHAEVLARRGAVRWLMEEIKRYAAAGTSEWIERIPSGRFALKSGIQVTLYVSTLPCKYLGTLKNRNSHST